MFSKQAYRGFDFKSCVKSIALAAIGSLVMHAQTQTPSLEASVPHGATVRGTVFDPAGLPVSKALISVLSPISGSVRTAQTEPSGEFSIQYLASGTYSLNVAGSGFTIELRTVNVHDGEVLDLGKIRLRLFSASQQVTVVSGSRLVELEDDSPSKVLAITKQQIQNTGYERLADVLSEVPGINTQTKSYGVGIVGGEQINGVDSKETPILQDGLPIAGGRGINQGLIDLNQQNIGKIQQVEVVEGAASSLYGTDAIGGVINMITRDATQPFNFDASLSGGTLGTIDGRFDLGGKWKNFDGFLDAESHQQNSYTLIPNDPATVGADTDEQDVFLKLHYTFNPRAVLGFTSSGYHTHEDGIADTTNLDPFLADQSPLTGLRSNESTQTYALLGDFVPTNTTTLQTRLYLSRYDEDSQSNLLLGQNSEGPAFDLGNLHESYRRADSTVGQQIGSRQFLQAGYEWVQDLYSGDNRLVGGDAGQQVTTNDIWIQDRIQLAHNLTVTLGGRLQHHSLYGNHLVPKAGLVYRINDHWVLRGSYGKGFRAPDPGDLYYHLLHIEYGYQVIGNPTLQPETSESFSTGATYTNGRYRLSLNLFRNNLNNLIDYALVCNELAGQDCAGPALVQTLEQDGVPPSFDYDTTGAAFFTYVNRNIDKAYTQGFNLDGSIALPWKLKFSGAYTYLEAVDSLDHIWLEGRNRHQGHVQLEYASRGWTANLRANLLSKWPTDTSGDYVFGYQIWNVYAAKRLGLGFEAFGAVDNLADSRDQKLDSPQPSFDRSDYGRIFRIGMRYTFSHEK